MVSVDNPQKRHDPSAFETGSAGTWTRGTAPGVWGLRIKRVSDEEVFRWSPKGYSDSSLESLTSKGTAVTS